jgi:hypothetical protein
MLADALRASIVLLALASSGAAVTGHGHLAATFAFGVVAVQLGLIVFERNRHAR